jgi:hypothetical protein
MANPNPKKEVKKESEFEKMILSKTTNKTLQSHLIGVLTEVLGKDPKPDKMLTKQELIKVWTLWGKYTGKDVKTHIPHGTDEKKISVKAFVTSALQH